jgi:hypothetical protein
MIICSENKIFQYKGQYKNDLKDGYGIYEWDDGRVYKGLWKEGK